MDAQATAAATAKAIGAIGGGFMLDGETYKRGAELGFQGLDFYATGRGGVLGEVDADVVAAAFTFFEPGHVRTQWELGRSVMSPSEAATAWATCCAEWADAHVPDDLDAAGLAELLDEVVGSARPACAAVFAGWRALDVPAPPKAHAVHQINALRELRNGLHGASVVAAGLTPHEALSLNSPQMAPLFGWSELAETDGLKARWDAAEQATNVAMAHAFAGLDDAGRDRVAELTNALHSSI